MNQENILKLEDVSLFYQRSSEGIKNIFLDIFSHEIVGLVGPNGAGKSTTFKVILGFFKTCTGRILFKGEEISSFSTEQRIQRGIGYLGQEISLFSDLTVYENLWLFLQYKNHLSLFERKEILEESLEMMKIQDLKNRRASYLSGGEKRRLEIARILIEKPYLIIFDEPFAGVDPVSVHSIQKLMKQLSSQGISILVSDHNVREVCRLINRMYVIIGGEVIADGNIEELKNNDEVSDLYFGRTFEEL